MSNSNRRVSAQVRYQRKGGTVPKTIGIAWDWQEPGPYMTSLVLESPRAPEFTVDMCFDESNPPCTPQLDALRTQVSRSMIRSPTFMGKERARFSEPSVGLAKLTAEVERMAFEKGQLLRASDSRSNFMDADDVEEVDGITALIQRNMKNVFQDGFDDLNTLRPRQMTSILVRSTSEHLLKLKGEAKMPLKVKSFRVRQEELEKKILEYRSDRSILKRRVKQYKHDMLDRNGGGTLIADFRAKLSAGAFNPDQSAEIRTLRMLQVSICPAICYVEYNTIDP